ncbi:hypothetical protein MW887_002493 [Aspergillus wentii]|nr:hypothetical protein MW887_002493 [Aspergillus wentii]
MNTDLWNYIIYSAFAIISYLILVSSLRFQRVNALRKTYSKYQTRQSLSSMTDSDAWTIQKNILQLEFPFISLKSLQFALFRTYGIPTISSLLLKTSQLSDTATSFKRYADTGTLIGEFMAFHPSSDRAHTAIARTKWLHTGYRASGSILEEDMLYTLSLFACEPIRFIEEYEWRSLTELEKCAIGTYWKSLGDALSISYECLPSGKIGFRDGIHWLEEVGAWSAEYEAANMHPHPRNKEIADKTMDVLVYALPSWLKPVGVYFASFIMDDRLRKAMMYSPPPPQYNHIFNTLISTRKFLLRHLALPRPYFLRYEAFTESPDSKSRHFMLAWNGYPYYVQPTLWNRYGPSAWFARAMGLPLPGDEGEKYYPHGYRLEDLGPRYFEGKGRAQIDGIKEGLGVQRRGQCPFA